MDSSNLAVIFAPNLLHSNENEKMSASTEKKIRLQAAVVETLIDHAAEIGKMINAYQRVSVHQPVCSFSTFMNNLNKIILDYSRTSTRIYLGKDSFNVRC